MEALSCGCAVVASNTEPVQEIIEAGKQGILVDFFDPDGLAARVDELLLNPTKREQLSINARNKILNSIYSLDICMERYLKLIHSVIN